MTAGDAFHLHQAVPIFPTSCLSLLSFRLWVICRLAKMLGSIQSRVSGTAVTIGFAVRMANAYTQVNIGSPFMQKNIDPIVFPGQYDKSHMHSFFGSDAVTINTTTSTSLQEGCTNAENPNDLSIYCTQTSRP